MKEYLVFPLSHDPRKWSEELELLRGTIKFESYYGKGYYRSFDRERLLKTKTYSALAVLPNGKALRAMALRDTLKQIGDRFVFSYGEDALRLLTSDSRIELTYQ